MPDDDRTHGRGRIMILLDLWYLYHHQRFTALHRMGEGVFTVVLKATSGASICLEGELSAVAAEGADLLRQSCASSALRAITANPGPVMVAK